MIPLILTSFVLIGTVSVLLIFSFGYSTGLAFSHMAVMILFSGITLAIIAYFRRKAYNSPRYRLPMHILGFIFLFFLLLFYALVIGSNYFWGNMVTYDIIRNYVVNLNEFLGILPVQKWLLILLIILYVILAGLLYFFVRVRLLSSPPPRDARFKQLNLTTRILLIVGPIFLLFLFRNSVMNAKRYLQFNQEPFVYFWLGPMWEIHSDRLFLTQPARTSDDERCIDEVGKKTLNNKTAIVILVDALRSDHLPMYGYTRNTSPFLDSIYNKGLLRKIKHSFSGSTNTVGGVSSLFFSKEWDSLNMTQLNLMQYFKKSGYSTYAFLTGYHSGWYGLSAMYRNSCDFFYESTSAYRKAIDDDLVTLKKFETTSIPQNSFLYIHLLSAHDVGKRDDRFRTFMPDKIGLNTGRHDPMVNHYDNGIVQADYVIKRIFEDLEKRKLLENATVFIVGDHGNLFGEEGMYGHAGGLHPKLLEVPILIYDKSLRSAELREIASLMDLAPTLTDHFFDEIPFCWRGQSLLKGPLSQYETIVTAATVKTSLYKGSIIAQNDSIVLNIEDKDGQTVKQYRKVDSTEWRITYKQ